MARKAFTVEYIIRSSPAILYNFLVQPSGLAQWFSDTCDIVDEVYSFGWNGTEAKASLLETVEDEYVAYHWEDSEEDEFFEFSIQKSEVSNDTVLVITDFADDSEVDDQILLWNSQVKMLIQQIGG